MAEHHIKVTNGRSFAFLLPETLRGKDIKIITANGIIYCHDVPTGLLYPLEAVCEKVRIPGVRYREEGDL